MKRTTPSLILLTPTIVSLALLSACGGGGGEDFPDPNVATDFDATAFSANSATVDNPYFPLTPGTGWVYEGTDDEGVSIRIETQVSHETRVVDGVTSAIVLDREFENNVMVEETFDWYAQDDTGNVWYVGEASAEYAGGTLVSTAGSWESGKDVAGIGTLAKAGVIMWQTPHEGDVYYQEFYPGEAQDTAEIFNAATQVTMLDGNTVTALQIREWNPLDSDSDPEYKFYLSGTGLIREQTTDGEEVLNLVSTSDQRAPAISVTDFSASTNINNTYLPLIPGTAHTYEIDTGDGIEQTLVEVLATTRTILGIDTVVVRDRVFLDGVIQEDTHDWFAQDNFGNVWYFGEEVDNYNYDDIGNLIDITHEGAWEAGVDGAQPGIVMPANPRVGDSYRQEFYAGEAEDLAAIAATNVAITLSDATPYTTLKIKEWNPLEVPVAVEFKYYAPGVGLVREENEAGDEQADLVLITTP